MILSRCDQPQLIRSLAIAFVSFILLIFTGVVNIFLGQRVQDTCSYQRTGRHLDDCRLQRHTVFLFIVFCIVRITSYKFEEHLISRRTKCHAKVTLPGYHVGVTLGIPFVVRKILPTLGVQSTVLLHIVTFGLSSMAFFPYFKDLFCLSRFVVYGVRSRFYKANQDLILTFMALYIYMCIVMVEFLDIFAELYCSQYIYGLPLLFPNINFPLLLYFLHSFIIMYHRKMPTIVYEVVDEDCFIQMQGMRCVSQTDCPELSYSVRLTLIPSSATTRDRQALDGKIVQVHSLQELEANLQVRAKAHSPRNLV